jgi:hypothetical protein
MFCRGSRLESGSWKIICIRRRILRSGSGPSVVSSTPSNETDPLVGGVSCRIARPSVDLPQPDSPTNPYVRPRGIARSTPSTAFTCPITLSKITPRVIGKCTLRSVTDTSGVASPIDGSGAASLDRLVMAAPRSARCGHAADPQADRLCCA